MVLMSVVRLLERGQLITFPPLRQYLLLCNITLRCAYKVHKTNGCCEEQIVLLNQMLFVTLRGKQNFDIKSAITCMLQRFMRATSPHSAPRSRYCQAVNSKNVFWSHKNITFHMHTHSPCLPLSRLGSCANCQGTVAIFSGWLTHLEVTAILVSNDALLGKCNSWMSPLKSSLGGLPTWRQTNMGCGTQQAETQKEKETINGKCVIWLEKFNRWCECCGIESLAFCVGISSTAHTALHTKKESYLEDRSSAQWEGLP